MAASAVRIPTPRAGWSAARTLRRTALPVLTGLALLVAWELISRANTLYLPRSAVPPPTDIVRALYHEAQTALYWESVRDTLEAWAYGLALTSVAAIPLGIVIGSSRLLFISTRAVIEFLRPIPGLTLLPLLVLVIGIGFNLKLSLVVIGAFWPLLIQSLYGVQDVDPVARDMARAYGLRRPLIFLRVVLPSSLPYVVTGFRLAAILALNITIGVELLVGSTTGIGEQMNTLQLANRVPEMYAYVVSAAVIGLVINALVRVGERRVLHWHASQRQAVPL
jgi:ABC-type nitrate/sulfonate/bicarbonate transport system permease component